jgi:hypothetical protein
MKDPGVQEEAKPEEKEKKLEKKLELLPPMSFYGKNHFEPPSLTQTSEELKNDKDNEVGRYSVRYECRTDFDHRKIITAFKWTNTYKTLLSLLRNAEHDVY